MKKILFLISVSVFCSIWAGMTSCGPSAEEKARMDSIRIADSLYRLDSLKLVDSLKTVKAAEEQKEQLRQKVDEIAESTGAEYVVKMYALGKVVYANPGDFEAKKYAYIVDASTGKTKSIELKGLATYYGLVVGILDKGNDRDVAVLSHDNGSCEEVTYNVINVEKEKITKTYDDYPN